jgi:hypothetical protein
MPQITMTSVQPQLPETDVLLSNGSHMRSSSVLSDPSTDAGDLDDPSSLADVQEVGEDVRGSDVLGLAWAQTLGLGWALEGLGLRNPRPDPELRAGLGLGQAQAQAFIPKQ